MSADVVSDTSPLQYLVLTGAIDILPRFFDRVYVPEAVAMELKHANTPALVRDWIASPPPWAMIQSVASISLGVALGLGERETISLALTLKVQGVLIDDQKARVAATRAGLDVVSTLAILERSAEHAYLDLSVALSKLRRTSFHIRPGLLEHVLERHKRRCP